MRVSTAPLSISVDFYELACDGGYVAGVAYSVLDLF
jgi:hypothetical protein